MPAHIKSVKGNTISELIADRFGSYGTKAYQEGIQLFKTINPQVGNINFIYVGQEIKLPDVSPPKSGLVSVVI